MDVSHRIKASFFTLILLVVFNTSIGQVTESLPVEIAIIHKDSISLSAEFLPEFRNSVHDKEYQGNQISGVIRTVFQDSKGDFWFGTQNGLCRNDKDGLVYFELKNWNGQGVTVHVILEDKIGNIWIGFGGGIAKFDGNFFTVFHEKNVLTKVGLWSMAMDKNGLLWIGTTQGVYTFNGQELSSFEIPEGKINPSVGISTTKMIHSIIEDSKGRMWFATNGGVYIYDDTTLINIAEKEGLLSNFVNRIIESKDGSFWISTSTAIYNYKENTLINITEKLVGQEGGIGCIYEDKSGTLWFSVNKRDIYSYSNNVFTKIINKESDFMPFPFEIYQDHNNRMWFVGFKGAYRFENDIFINVNREGPW